MGQRYNHGSPRPAVFLDRDGTINVQVGHVNDPAQITLMPRAAEAIARINRMGFHAIVVTNQSAVARGLATIEQVRRVCSEVALQAARQAGARIDAFYACPYHPEHPDPRWEPFKTWRKPDPGMFLAAQAEFPIDVENSWLVGDGAIDHQAAKAANAAIRTVLLPSEYHNCDCGADFYAASLWDAVGIISVHSRDLAHV